MLARLTVRGLNVTSRCCLSTDIFSADSNAASKAASPETGDFDITPNIPEAEESIEREEKFRQYVERMRNVSRFSKVTAERKFNKKPPTFYDAEARYLKNQSYFRLMYSKFGRESGIEAGIAWPTRQELLNKIDEEAVYDLSLKKKVQALVERKQAEIDNIEKLERDVDEALVKMPKMIEKFYQGVSRKDIAEEEKTKKREEIMDQAREYYGFKVDLRDRRIKDMVDKLQEEKKKVEKAKKKEEEKKKQTLMKQLKIQEGESGQ